MSVGREFEKVVKISNNTDNKYAKYSIIVQIYLQLFLKTLGNLPKTTIYVLHLSYICIDVI